MRVTNISHIKASASESSILKVSQAHLELKSETLFEQNEADIGGAISLLKQSNMEASDSTFKLNKARSQAGALYA